MWVHEGASLRQQPRWKVGGQSRVRFLTRTAETQWLKLASERKLAVLWKSRSFLSRQPGAAGPVPLPALAHRGTIGDRVMSSTPAPGITWCVSGCEAPSPLPSFRIPVLAACRDLFGMGVSETALVYEHSKPRVVWG